MKRYYNVRSPEVLAKSVVDKWVLYFFIILISQMRIIYVDYKHESNTNLTGFLLEPLLCDLISLPFLS